MIYVDDNHRLFDLSGMEKHIFETDFKRLRYYSLLLVQKLPPDFAGLSLLESQVFELLKNGMEHGNRYDEDKLLTVWSGFTDSGFRIVVQDEGEGFREVDRWNEWSRIRLESLRNGDGDVFRQYLGYKPSGTGFYERNGGVGGLSLFAAEEFWNNGLVFSSKGNRVAAGRRLGMDFCSGALGEE